MVTIESPFPSYALPRVWGWLETVKSRVADDFGPKTAMEWVDRQSESTEKTWGVYRDGELGGMISFQQYTGWLGTAHCVFKPDFWGRAITRPAVELALKEMFGSGIEKLSFYVFSDNRAIRSLLSEFGATVEGNLKRHTMRNGKPADMVALAIFKEKFDATSSNCSGQPDSVGCGKRDVGEQIDVEPLPVAGNAADGRRPPVVLHGVDVKPYEVAGADEARSDQPSQ